MGNDEKFDLITRNLEETLTPEELKSLIESGTPLKHYIGFEISGKLHLGYLFTALKVKDLQDAGAETIIWLADLHSAINDKLDGNIETIKRVARGYFTDAFKILFQSIGGDPEKLQFKLCSETYAENPDFWLTFLGVGKNTTLARTKRSVTIMGREESEDIDTAKLMYPIMQAADIFLLGVNIAHAGIDQRKVHVIARDVAVNLGQTKPVAIHHPILLGLQHPASNLKEGEEGLTEEGSPEGTKRGIVRLGDDVDTDNDTRDIAAMKIKMSKSKADSGILVHDSPEEIKKKIGQAYAPPKDTTFNPILNWTRYLIFYDKENSRLEVKRETEHGGNFTYTSFEELYEHYSDGRLHPLDLKNAVAEWLIIKLEPARKYFEDPKRKSALEEIEKLTQK